MKGARQFIAKCSGCHKEYDLVKLVNATRGQELVCPTCGQRLGRKN